MATEPPTTLFFVRVVSTVVVVVALPAAGDTAVVLAAELVGLTRPLVYGRTEEWTRDGEYGQRRTKQGVEDIQMGREM